MSSRRPKMTKFRLKMDMSQFYDDERNLAYILVNPKWDQVVCLQEHVEKLFDVPSVQFLTDDGVYIPPLESIDVIKSSDVLRAIIPQKIKKKKKKSKPLYDGFGEDPPAENSIEIQGEKRKCDDDRLTCSTPNYRPTKKQKTSVGVTKCKALSLPQSPVNDVKGYSTCSNAVTSTNSSATLIESPGLQELTMHTGEENEETTKGRKRKRIRKKKKSDETVEVEEKISRFSSVPVPISSSTLRMSKTMSTPNRSPKHVHFDEGETLPKEEVETVEFRCQLSISNTPEAREIGAEEREVENSSPKKPKIQIQENIVLVRGNNVSVAEEEPSVIEVDDSTVWPATEENNETAELTSFECAQKTVNGDGRVEATPTPDITVDVVLPLSEPLLGTPEVGDIVLFKIIGLNDGFTPGISDFICGRCEKVDSIAGTVSFLVLDGLDQIDGSHPNFAAGDRDDIKLNPSSSVVQVEFGAMLDKKLFKMS